MLKIEYHNVILKLKSKFYNIFALVVGYMFNKYAALLPSSLLMPICMCQRIYNSVIYYTNFNLDNKNLSIELVITLFITIVCIVLSTFIIYSVLDLLTNKIIKIYDEIKNEAIRIYRGVYYPTPTQNNNIEIIENTNLISYQVCISIIKKSIYGESKKLQAIKNGLLKDLGGEVYKN